MMDQEPHKKEAPSTYFVQDRSNEEELKRLRIQDQMVTTGMGGVLPDELDASKFQRVLEVGSGTGGWVIDMAQRYPTMSLVGTDISIRMIEYARAQALAAHVEDRVEFRRMDALLMLEFRYDSFDLVNLRFGSSFLRTWDWPKLLSEFLRVTRDDGIVRITEGEVSPQNTSPALTRLYEMLLCAFSRAGHHFEYGSTGLISYLPQLLTQHGYQQVHMKNYALEFRTGTPEAQMWNEDVARVFRTTRPFLEKWGCASKDFDATYQQALADMQQPDFHITWNIVSAFGTKMAP
jgi:ubiquinone/menaquinone biosynthesis C-methylase UbiE